MRAAEGEAAAAPAAAEPEEGEQDAHAGDAAMKATPGELRRLSSVGLPPPTRSRTLWKGVDAYFQLANTYYTGRLALSTLCSFLSLCLLCVFARDKSFVVWIWISLQVLNVLLGVAALPDVQLYSRGSSDDDEDAKKNSAGGSSIFYNYGSIHRNDNRTSSFSFLRLAVGGGDNDGRQELKLSRSPMLYLCEVIVIFQTISLVWMVLLIIGVFWAHSELDDMFNEHLSDSATVLSILAAICIMLQTIQFDRLRTHQQLQLGAGLEEEEPPAVAMADESSRSSTTQVGGGNADVQARLLRPNVDSSISEDEKLQLGSTAKGLEKKLRTSLFDAVRDGDHLKVEQLFSHAEHVLGSKVKLQILLLNMYNTPMRVFWSFAHSTMNPLHEACRQDDVRMVEILLEAGLNPNLLDKVAGASFDLQLLYEICQLRMKNITHVLGSPLHVAALKGHTEVIDMLVRYGANLDVVAKTSFFSHSMRVTPVFLCDSTDVIENLIRHRANILVVPGRGNAMSTTVLQRAQLKDRRELALVLEEWGADVALTPLHEAAAAGDLATVKHLLAWGIDADELGEYQVGVHRRTPLHWASVMGRRPVIAELIKCNADVNARDSFGRTPLHWAARHNNTGAVEELLIHGADPLLLDCDGLTPLAFGVIGGLVGGRCVELFIQHGVEIDANILNEYEDTCLHLALRLGHRDVALALLKQGTANLYSINGLGRKAVECCASAELQYAVKVAGECVDVVLSFDPVFRKFADRVRRGIEDHFITVYMRDAADDGKRSKKKMKNASAVVCVLSSGYEKSNVCMEELAFAKQNQVPVVAISCESMYSVPDELQVYLYTRQMVPFGQAVTSSHTMISTAGSVEEVELQHVEFELDEDKFQSSLRSLIDGLRDEVELHRLGGHDLLTFAPPGVLGGPGGMIPRPSSARSSFQSGANLSALFPSMRDSSIQRLQPSASGGRMVPGGLPTAKSGATRRRTLDGIVNDVIARSSTSAHMMGGTGASFSIFLSHGDCHSEFVTDLSTELRRHQLPVVVDSMTNFSSMKARILAAKDAILQSSIVLVVLSEKSTKTELVSDQLAFAEDRGKIVVPVYFTKKPRLVDATLAHLLEQETRAFLFGDDLSYGRGFDELLRELRKAAEKDHAVDPAAHVVLKPAVAAAAQRFMLKSRPTATSAAGVRASIGTTLVMSNLNLLLGALQRRTVQFVHPSHESVPTAPALSASYFTGEEGTPHGHGVSMASCLRAFQKWRARIRTSLPVIKSGVVICTLFALDIRDAIYKVLWIGATDSFHFRTGSTIVLQQTAAVPILTAQNGSLASGWPSFLSRCTSITPFCGDGSTFFLSALLTDCRLDHEHSPPLSTTLTMPKSLVLTSAIRVDSLAWATCKLLYVGRRPSICQEDIVANFYRRYAFRSLEIPESWMAPVESRAEDELLRFLDMISLSVPYHKVICGEAFEFDPTHVTGSEAVFEPTLYGCASPNLHRSEFVGLETPLIRNLLFDKAWLTADVVQFMNIHYGIRQNCEYRYQIARDGRGRTLLLSDSKANFSSYGQLYVVLILIDVSLLLLHFLSSVEIFTWMLLPEAQEVRDQLSTTVSRTASQLKLFLVNGFSAHRRSSSSSPATVPPSDGHEEHHNQPDGLLEENLFYSFFSRSLYRSTLVVVVTVATQLISWLLVMPNSVVWTWSDSVTQKLQAYLSSIRVWVLILLLMNALWNVVVLANEEMAYWFVKGTFISSFEILLISATVSFVLRDKVFAMCEIKWAIEKQRVYDATSFPGLLAHGNTFSLAQDYVMSTPADVFWVIYEPLLHILAWSFVTLMLFAVTKFVFYAKGDAWTAYVNAALSRSRLGRSLAVVWPTSSNNSPHHHQPTQRTQQETSRAYANSNNHISIPEQTPATQQAAERKYARSQIEQMLDCPVRAKSLIRNTLQMETTDADTGRVHISPSCYLDFGVMMRNGDVRSRICFSNVLVRARRPENELSLALEDHPQMARRRSSLHPLRELTVHSGPLAMRKRSPLSWNPSDVAQ